MAATTTLTWLQIITLVGAWFGHLGALIYWVTRTLDRAERRLSEEAAALRRELASAQHALELKLHQLHGENQREIAVLKQSLDMMELLREAFKAVSGTKRD